MHRLCPAVGSMAQPSTPMRISFFFQGARIVGRTCSHLAALFVAVAL